MEVGREIQRGRDGGNLSVRQHLLLQGRDREVCVCVQVCDRECVMVRINSDRPFDAWMILVSLFLLLMCRLFWSLSLSLCLSACLCLSSVHLAAILIVASSLSALWLSFSSVSWCVVIRRQLFHLAGYGAQAQMGDCLTHGVFRNFPLFLWHYYALFVELMYVNC